MLPGGASGDNAGGEAMLDAGAETLIVGRSKDNEVGGGTILGARVDAHDSVGGAISEKIKSKKIICVRNRER